MTDPTEETLIRATETMAANTSEVLMLRMEVAKERRARKSLSVIVAVVGVFAIVLVWVGLSNRATLGEVRATQEYVIECTTPGDRVPTADDPRTGHPCFDDGQARTAEAVNAIITALKP